MNGNGSRRDVVPMTNPANYSKELLDRLAKCLLDLTLLGSNRTWSSKAKEIWSAMSERGADSALEEFVSWQELLSEDPT